MAIENIYFRYDQIMATSEEKIVCESLESAELFLQQGNYGKAFAHYLLVLQLMPSKKEDIKHFFALAFTEWAELLVNDGRMDEMFTCYSHAREMFPECEIIVNKMGTLLFRFGMIDDAANCFRKAIRMNPDYLAARENLENTCSHLVERWHFRMLNDVKRNQAYRAAIHRAVAGKHKNVLDVGSGTGILSMIAVEAGAKTVHACEMSKTMYEISKDVFAENDMERKVSVINKSSLELEIPADIPEKVTLLVTETFDAGLLGEHILPTVQHAWDKLLMKERDGHLQSQIIPAGATVYTYGVECNYIRKQHKLIYTGFRHLEIPTHTGVTSDVSSDNEDEPYSSEMLSTVPGGYKIITGTTGVWDFNFQDPETSYITTCMEGTTKCFSLNVKEHGRLDAFILWFDLHLDDCTTLTSSPCATSCWEQAVYPVPCQDSDSAVFLEKGQTVNISLTCRNNAFRLGSVSVQQEPSPPVQAEVLHPNSGMSSSTFTTSTVLNNINTERRVLCEHSPRFSQSNNVYDKLPDFKSALCNHTAMTHRNHVVSSMELVRLNDIDFNTKLCIALEQIIRNSEKKDLSLLHFALGTSVVSLQCLKLLISSVTVSSSEISMQQLNMDLLLELAEFNAIDMNRLSFCGRNFDEELEPEEKFDILLVDLIEPSGCLQQQILEDIAMARVTSLKEGGLIVPYSASVWGMVVDSPALARDSGVISDKDTLNFHIADFINDFQMTTHEGIHLSTLEHTRLTEPFEMLNLNFNTEPCTSAPSYLDLSLNHFVKVVSPGDVTAVIYWFELRLSDRDADSVSTLDHRCHWSQAAVMQKQSLSVSEGDTVHVNVVCKTSCIHVTVLKK